MGLSASLTNALSGMGTGQASLEILSRNVANAGTPGYHRQSLSVIDTTSRAVVVHTSHSTAAKLPI